MVSSSLLVQVVDDSSHETVLVSESVPEESILLTEDVVDVF